MIYSMTLRLGFSLGVLQTQEQAAPIPVKAIVE
jgi:hypothetical protein